jgi:hypothetical protein
MCIMCNLGFDKGDEFLFDFVAARHAMEKAAQTMKECAAIHRPYDRTHKRMVKLIRDWNRIEQERETPRSSPRRR